MINATLFKMHIADVHYNAGGIIHRIVHLFFDIFLTKKELRVRFTWLVQIPPPSLILSVQNNKCAERRLSLLSNNDKQ